EIVGDLELDLRRLHTEHLSELGGEAGRPASRLTAEDRLHRLLLALVRARIEEEAHVRLRVLVPDVPLEPGDGGEVQPVQADIPEAAFVDVPDEDAVAVALGGWLGERAGAGHRPLADVDPIPDQMPARNLGHPVTSVRDRSL